MSSQVPDPDRIDTSLNVRGTFEVLSDAVDRFIDAWEGGAIPPDLVEFLPEGSGSQAIVLAELIKVDLEYRWLKADLPKRLHEYFEEFPELVATGIPVDLIYEEFHVRRRSGLQVDPEEYLAEFPDRAILLQPLLGLVEEYRSTLLGSGVRSAALADVDVGDRLDDFELLLSLGKGAFARVFLARQQSMQRLVAVKISEDKGLEPQTLSKLDHDYIVRVYDVRRLPDLGLRLLYMQYLPGGTLEGVVEAIQQLPRDRRSGQTLLDVVDRSLEHKGEIRPTDSSLRRQLAGLNWPDTVAWIGSRLAQALHYAHEQRIQHRDVKPANVLLTAEGVPKLADFNISFGEGVEGATAAAYFGGSLAYMSPEQLAACHPHLSTSPDDLDGRSDLYSLAVVLYELLEGRRPFPDDIVPGNWNASLERMIDSRRRCWRQAIESLAPETPATLQRILTKGLHPQREKRYAEGTELSRQLELSTDPRAAGLIDPPATSWRVTLRPWAMPLLILSVLVPNIVAAVANYHYNRDRIVSQVQGALPKFDLIQAWINGILFPVGTLLLIGLAWRVVRQVPREADELAEDPVPVGEASSRVAAISFGRAEQSLATFIPDPHNGSGAKRSPVRIEPESAETPEFLQARWGALRLGEVCAFVCLAEWILAGIAYPVSFRLAQVELTWGDAVHFFSSLVICGLMATAYPFFGVTFFCLRSLYPAFLQRRLSLTGDLQELNRLHTRCERYLIVAAAIPLLAIAGLSSTTTEERLTVQFLCWAGLLAYVAAWWCQREIQEDLAALRRVVA